jgi:hypothetical protein
MLHIGNISSTVKTETADVRALLHARGVSGNGHVRVNAHGSANGHARNGHSKKTRRAKPHMKNGLNQAACHALGAVLLIRKCGATIDQAIAYTTSNTTYIEAMKWIVANGDMELLGRVLHGRIDIFDAAEKVRPMVEIKAAYKKLTAEQRITWAAEEDPNTLFNEVIVPASVVSESMKPATTNSM